MISCSSGGEAQTTNNRMELEAVIHAIEDSSLLGAEELSLFTDSQYVKGLTVGVITAISINDSLEGQYAIVSPSADFRHVEEVLVLRQLVEKADGTLVALPTPTPMPTASVDPNASPTPLPTPTPDPNTFYYPSAAPTGQSNAIEDLPEDAWVGN